MADREFIGLDNPIFRNNLKVYQPRETVVKHRRPIQPARVLTDLVDKPLAPTPPAKRAVAKAPVKLQQQSQVLRRDAVRKPIPLPVAAKRRRKRPVRQKLLPAMAVLLFLIGIGVSFISVKTTHEVNVQAQSLGPNTSSGVDETQPSPTDVSTYQVAPDLPKIVRIAKINVAARIKRVTTNAQNQLGAPGNVHDVGWYDGSSKPGDAGGATFLDSHVSGPTVPGAFHDIKKLVPGDIIEVERGDGTKYTYKVVKSQVYDKDKVDMAAALVSAVPGKVGLNLMTCTGPIKGIEYQQRLMVFAIRQ
jgi:sortase (surface protein transpeptidase)